MVEVKDLTIKYGKNVVVNNVSFSAKSGEWVMIAGPNGAGKSTILKAISQAIEYDGQIRIRGVSSREKSSRELARDMAVLSQNNCVHYSFTVEEIVRLGRYSHSGRQFSGKNGRDDEMVKQALALTGMDVLREKSVLSLSGGELQRTFLAQVFAQDPKILLLDEPTNHLDLVYQKQIFSIVSEWLKVPDRCVISVVHDLSLAKAFGTSAILLDKGECVAKGKAGEVLDGKYLDDVYDMDVSLWMTKMLSQWSCREQICRVC